MTFTPRRLLGYIAICGAWGCSAIARTFVPGAYPNFDSDRTIRSAEPLVLRAPSSAYLETVVSADGRELVGMPIAIEIERPPHSWSELPGSAILFDVTQRGHRDTVSTELALLSKIKMASAPVRRALYIYPKGINPGVLFHDTADPKLFGADLRGLVALPKQAGSDSLARRFYVPGVDSVAVGRKVVPADSAWKIGSLSHARGASGMSMDSSSGVLVSPGAASPDSLHIAGHWYSFVDPNVWSARVTDSLSARIADIDFKRLDSDYTVAKTDWPSILAEEKRVMSQLDIAVNSPSTSGFWLICRPRALNSQCLEPGRSYEIQFALPDTAKTATHETAAVYPLRIERRSRPLSAALGVLLIAIFLGASAG